MSKQLITKERYDTLKTILNNLPTHQKGLNKVYKAIGIGDSSASYIRRSVDYADYKRMTSRPKTVKQINNERADPDNTIVVENLATDGLMKQHLIIMEMLNRQAEQLEDISLDLTKLVENQITKKRGWL